MKLRLVPPLQGVSWVQQSLRIFVRQPVAFASLFAACLFVLLVLGIVPVVGAAAPLLLSPFGTLLFMLAGRLGAEGQPVMPGAVTGMLGVGRRTAVALLQLGAAYLVAGVVTFWLCGVIDGGSVDSLRVLLRDPTTKPEVAAARFADPRVQLGLVLRLLCATALSVPFWHAPALVHWGRQSVAKALFSSSVAIWRNGGAFTVYGLAWSAICFVLLLLAASVLGVVGPQGVLFVAAPLTLVMLTLLYVSLYFTFADCFADDAPAPGAPANQAAA